jgi:hypothetical protein
LIFEKSNSFNIGEIKIAIFELYGSRERNFLFQPRRTCHSKGDSEIAEAWFDQATEYWKQAIVLTPGNYIEAQNWLKITKHFEFE